ncbi:Trp biosynthesis-associated membrane protein [Nocardioides sp.]|uniref:Trp biosynthesis-associated membrane protein n=1 Tax=Nocardioides sp. TaxID=35761 RepID=UPI002ED16002
MTDRRRTFGPVAVLGIAAAVLAAVASAQPWARLADPADAALVMPIAPEDGEMALAAAVSLVLLASWGVVLVTRGVVRRIVAGLGLLSALGLAVVAYAGWTRLPDSLVESLREAGAESPETELTGWYWAALLAIAVSIAATSLAVAWCPAWPEMGTRYDAPGADRQQPPPEDRTSLDLWKSMDEGRDPTA